MNLKNQKPVLVPIVYWAELERVSKAALMDIVWSLAARCTGLRPGAPAIMDEFRRERDDVLAVREQMKGAR